MHKDLPQILTELVHFLIISEGRDLLPIFDFFLDSWRIKPVVSSLLIPCH